MKQEIVKFIKEVCKEYNIQAVYIPNDDTYFLHKNGRAIQTFKTEHFYQLPKKYRKFMIRPLIKTGLNHSLGEKTKDGMFGSYKLGKNII